MKGMAVVLMLALIGCMPARDPVERNRTLVIAQAFAPDSLDPAQSTTGNEAPILAQMYETLTGLDPESPDAAVTGVLAQNWAIAPDGLSIDLTLRQDRVFSDGTPVKADDVVWSFRRVKTIGRASAYYLEWLDRVEAVDRHMVRLFLKKPYAPALQMLAQPALGIVNRRAVPGADTADLGRKWLDRNSAGSGSYQSFRFTPGDGVTLASNPRATIVPVQFERIEFRALPDEGVRRLLLERGDVDLTNIVPAALVSRYRTLGGVTVSMVPGGMSQSFLALNARKGLFADPRLRRAAALTIDYAALRAKILKGNVAQLSGYLTPGTPGFDTREPAPQRDLAGARALLGAAEYNGAPVTLLVSQLGPVAEFIQSNLTDAGFVVRIERRQPGAIAAMTAAGQFDLIYDGWSLDSPDATLMIEALLTSKGLANGTNRAGYTNPVVDRNVEAAMATRDPATRTALLTATDRILRADRPIVFLFSANPVIAYRRDLVGVGIDRYRPNLLKLAPLRRAAGVGR